MPTLARRVAAAFACVAAAGAAAGAPDAARQRELVRLVRQDCGSCHGLRLTGGLGPSLDAGRMKELPLEFLAATIDRGRPGTPMPGWAPLLRAGEAEWIARQLQLGLPAEQR